MRWWCTLLSLVLLWLAYGLSPYIALYRLARAAQSQNVQAVSDRINFRTLRLSLSRQATAAALDAITERRDLSAPERQMLTEAAASLAEPVVAALVTPESVTDLLDDGWPQHLDLGGDAAGGKAPEGKASEGKASEGKASEGKITESKAMESRPARADEPARQRGGLTGTTLAQLFALFRSAEPRGFRGVVVSYPPDQPKSQQYHLRLRLRGWTWRVVELDLPAVLRQRLTQKLVRLPRR